MNTDCRIERDCDALSAKRSSVPHFGSSNRAGCRVSREGLRECACASNCGSPAIEVEQQTPVDVRYRGEVVGDYVADLVVERLRRRRDQGRSRRSTATHEAQCLNYLRATGLRICLLLNFGRPRLEVQRVSSWNF